MNGFVRALTLSLALAGLAIGTSVFAPVTDARPNAGMAVGPSDWECAARPNGKTAARVKAFETTFFSGDPDKADVLLADALAEIRTALQCSPTDADLWTASARLTALREGITQQVADQLRLSCRTGPYLTWTARARLAGFDRVRSALPNDVIACLDRDRAITGGPQPPVMSQ
jgi:hypothetical protein